MPQTQPLEILPAGEGVIEPTNRYTDQQVVEAIHEASEPHEWPQQVVEAIHEAQKPVEDEHVVCIDARPAEEAQPVRRKLAGGNAVTGTAAALYARWTLMDKKTLDEDPMKVAEAVIDQLDRTGAKIGGHWGEAVCGALKLFEQIAADAGAIGTSDLVLGMAKKDLGSMFDPTVMIDMANGAARFAQSPGSKLWVPERLAERVKEVGVLESLTDNNLHPDLDPNNARHGHWEEAIYLNSDPDVGNDRDHAAIQFFQVDLVALEDTVKRLARDPDEFKQMLHAGALYQYATAYRLTKNQRIVRTDNLPS